MYKTSSHILDPLIHIINNRLIHLSTSNIHDLLKNHLKNFHIMNENETWACKELEEIKDILLPIDITAQDLIDFVHHTQKTALRNSYLCDFIETAQNYPGILLLKQKIEFETVIDFPQLISLSFLLNRLTEAMYHQYQLIRVLRHIWKKQRSFKRFRNSSLRQQFGKFGLVKLLTVDSTISDYLKRHDSGLIWCFGIKLFVNILEGVLKDTLAGFCDNASAGWILAKNSLPALRHNKFTHASPHLWDADFKGVNLGYPLPNEWNDLYTVWNMAICFSNAPASACILLLPIVNDYAKNPKGYMYKRVLALYAYGHYLLFTDKAINNWMDPAFIQFFGEINKRNAEKYRAALRKSKHIFPSRGNSL